MIQAGTFIEAARRHGFRLWTGVPCSYLKPFINAVIDDTDLRYVGAANEGDAIALAAGAELGGMRGIVMFQNSGLGNAVNPLTSLTWTFRIPVLLIPTLRGEPGGPPDEPQHALMGRITTDLLERMEVPWEFFPADESEIEPALGRATAWMETEQRPYALVMKKGAVAPRDIESSPEPRDPGPAIESAGGGAATSTRSDFLVAVQTAVGGRDVVVASTGYTGRELHALDDRASQIYMVGSMGCAASLGLGLALAQPQRRVVVLDGDGAALMRLGSLATVGYERPPNLVHVLLDNQVHESTGGQSTVSHSTDLGAVAAACGYPRVERVVAPAALAALLAAAGTSGPIFIHARVRPGVPDGLPRPSLGPADVAARLRHFLRP